MIHQLNETAMTNEQRIIDEKWRALNLRINQYVKSMKQNEKAGMVYDSEYKEWLSALMKERDTLTLQLVR